jgi:ABC-type phosphate transport system substrate-binding protein
MNAFKTALLAISLVVTTSAMAGDVVVVVNKGNSSAVDKALVAKIYFGESKSWSDNSPVVAYDLPEENPERANFSSELLGKSVSNMKALASRNMFSGKAVPPKELASDDEVKKNVAANKGAIGYIKASSVDDTVKVVVK